MDWAALVEWAKVAPLFTAGTAIAAFVSIVLAFFSLKRAKLAPAFSKSIDVINDCYKRYDDLTKERYEVLQASKRNREGLDLMAQCYFERYWSLQSDQFKLFLMGLIDPATFGYWTVRKLKFFRSKEKIGPWTPMEAWMKIAREHHSQDAVFGPSWTT